MKACNSWSFLCKCYLIWLQRDQPRECICSWRFNFQLWGLRTSGSNTCILSRLTSREAIINKPLRTTRGNIKSPPVSASYRLLKSSFLDSKTACFNVKLGFQSHYNNSRSKISKYNWWYYFHYVVPIQDHAYEKWYFENLLHLEVRDPNWGDDSSHSLNPSWGFPRFLSAVRQMPWDLWTTHGIISLSHLTLADRRDTRSKWSLIRSLWDRYTILK